MTEESQPGEPAAGGSAQRAHNSGFCSAELAARIELALIATDLLAQVWPCESVGSPYTVAVTLDGGRALTWAGGYTPGVITGGFFAPGTRAVEEFCGAASST